MLYLTLVSLLWAVSPGLIKGLLVGADASAIATVRLAFSLAVFLPLLRPRAVAPRTALSYGAIGAAQFGLMYVFYIAAFADLAAHEVMLFTVVTPLWVAVVDDVAARRLSPWTWAAALLAVAGAALIKWTDLASPGLVRGFLLVQASNLAFALGQVAYRRVRARHPAPPDRAVFGWLYLGGALTAGAVSLALSPPGAFNFSSEQWGVLAWLGVIASGLGFFGWNVGATRVDPGTLAVFNNLKIPLAIAVSLVAFGEQLADPTAFAVGSAVVLGALALSQWAARRSARPGGG